jgi:hypothetical protein
MDPSYKKIKGAILPTALPTLRQDIVARTARKIQLLPAEMEKQFDLKQNTH